LKMLESIGAFRQVSKLDDFLLACEADSKGRLGYELRDYPQADWLRKVYQVASSVNAKKFVEQGLKGKQIGEAVTKERIYLIQGLKKQRDS